MILYFHVEAPHHWVLLDRRGEVVDTGRSDSLDLLPLSKQVNKLIGVVPGGAVSVRQVELSARTRSKAQATVPYALEEKLATDVDDLVFTILDWKLDEGAIVAITESSYIESLQGEFLTLMQNVDALVPEYLLVPMHEHSRFTLVKLKNGSYAVRTGECSGTLIDDNMLEYWWESIADPHVPIAVHDKETARRLIEYGGTAISEWDIGSDFSQWLTHGRTPIERINIMQGVYSAEESSAATSFFKAAVVILCIGVVVRTGVDVFENYQLRKQDKQIDHEIVRVFHETFPDVRRIVNPRLQMEQQIKALKSGTVDAGRFQLLLSSVAHAVPQAQATVEEVTFRDQMLVITCTTQDFAGLDRLKQAFSQDKRVRAELISSGSRDNQVSARFRLQQV